MIQKITREEVRHVAKLARMDLDEQEEVRMTEQMNGILSYMETLNQLDTGECAPMTHAIQLHNVFRKDDVLPSLDREKVLENAPQSDGASFVVPKII